MIKALLKNAWEILRRPVNPLWLILALGFLLIIPFDAMALSNWRFADKSPADNIARIISSRGDFYNGCLVMVAILFATGCLFNKKRFRFLAIAMIFSCMIAGIITLAVRITSGRPRPSLDVPDGLYGPRFTPNRHGFLFFDYDYQAFPSGHATTAFATAIPVLVVEPLIGIPVVGAALSVTWARLQLKRHRLSDLYMGMLIGSFFGFAFGAAAKKISS